MNEDQISEAFPPAVAPTPEVIAINKETGLLSNNPESTRSGAEWSERNRLAAEQRRAKGLKRFPYGRRYL